MADDQQLPKGQATGVDEQARQQTGQQVRLRLNQQHMSTSYANAFRTNATADEVILDIGLNQVIPTGAGAGGASGDIAAEIQFDVSHRVIMNYFTAKRMAITLGQIVRQHEERFGELKLNVADRVTNKPNRK